MVNRVIVYPGAIPLDTDVLQTEQNMMIAIGYALQAAYGQNTVAVGLTCTPTAPASLQIVIGPGGIITTNVIESTPMGSLPQDTTDPLVKMGINISSTAFTLTPPSTAGQSINYLVEASFTEQDDSPNVLTYYNSLNPNQPYTGPNNAGTPQNTRRAQRASLQVKAGSPAASGTQITPPVDTGWIGLYVVQVNFGQTAITAGSISAYPGAPLLAPFLASHHGGVPGQAPKINLATEVQGVLSPANLPSAVGSSLVYAGNPNGHVAGTAASGSTPPTMCWDTVNLEWWTCVVSGSAATAGWSSTQNGKNYAAFFAPGATSWTVPPGVTEVYAEGIGAGGGGGGSTTTTSSQVSVAAGGNSGCYGKGLYPVTPGQVIPITIGTGGAGGVSGGANGSNGGTTSFGTFLTCPGGHGGTGGIAIAPPVVVSPTPTANQATGGNILNGAEGPGQGGACGNNVLNAYGGAGASGPWGGGGGAAAGGAGGNALAPGSGGGGAGLDGNTAGQIGGYGANGCLILYW